MEGTYQKYPMGTKYKYLNTELEKPQMPEITQEQANILNAMQSAIRGSSSSFTKQQSRSDTPSSKQTAVDRADRLRADKANKDLKEASKLFADSVDKNEKTSDQWKLQVERSSKFLNNAVTAVSQQSNLGASAFDGIEKVFKMEDQLGVLQEIRETFETGKEIRDSEIEDLKTKLRSVGLGLGDVGIRTKKLKPTLEIVNGKLTEIAHRGATLAKNHVKLDERVTETTKKLKKASDGLERMAKSAEMAEKISNGAFAAVGVAAKLFIDESSKVMARGLADARDGFFDTAKMVAKLGISTSKYIDLLGDNRRVQLAMNSAGKSFKKQLIETSDSLMEGGLVAGTEEAALGAAAFMKNTALMGVEQGKLGDAVQQQQKIYTSHYRALGMSLGQFNALTEEMLNSEDVRADLAKLDEKERRAYVESLQKRQAETVMMGFSIERARELNKHFAKISEENPLERIGKAAKTRAFLGAIGMGKEGAEYQRLTTLLPTLKGEDKNDAMARLTKIMSDAQKTYQELKGRDVGTNIAIGQLAASSGVLEDLTRFQTESKLGMKITKDGETNIEAINRLAEVQAQKGEVDLATRTAVEAANTLEALATSSATIGPFIMGSWLFKGGMESAMRTSNISLAKMATMGGMGGGGGPLTAKGLVKGGIVAAIVGYSASNIMDLIESGGKTSGAYETLSDWLGTGEKGIGGAIYDWLDRNSNDAKDRRAENAVRDARIEESTELTKQLVELNKQQVVIQKDGVDATNNQTTIQDINEKKKEIKARLSVIHDLKGNQSSS